MGLASGDCRSAGWNAVVAFQLFSHAFLKDVLWLSLRGIVTGMFRVHSGNTHWCS